MKYGYFDDVKKEYVITTPETPYPWINYLGTKDYFAMISNNAGGYSFYKDARLRRITRFRYNNVPLDLGGGKYYYINDSGDYWSPAYSPARKELEEYECRHGMGYTTIKGKRNKIAVNTTFFVPLDYNGEIHKLSITNEDDTAKEITLFSFIEWSIWDAQDDATNFQRNLNIGAVEIEGSVIYNKTEYRERRNHYAFFSVNTPIDGFDTDRDEFLGKYNGFQNPDAVTEGKSHNSIADGWTPIASHSIRISLEPKETKDFVFILGYAENKPDEKWDSQNKLPDETLYMSHGSKSINKSIAKDMIDRFATVKQVNQAFEDLKLYWEELLSKYVLYHEDDKLCRMVNIWNQYQCMVTFNMSRSASYFESGIGRGMGFRDSNQDLLGFVHQIPERARERILDLAATQLQDGGAYHQYQPLTKRGNNEIGSNFNDDPLWLVLAVTAYVKESGDFSILDEIVPFENQDELAAPLTEHLKRALNHVTNNMGPHNLPLIGRADWNDCLNLNCFSNEPGESFQTTTNKDGRTAESILIAGMYTMVGAEYVELMKHSGDKDEANRVDDNVKKMREAVMTYGYDGEWFLRAYDDRGKKVGSSECEEGKIFIEPQGFCIMGGCGVEDGRAEKALESVDKYLATKYGLVLNYPAFSRFYIEYGEISCYPAGYKENAGIFCHNNAWVICAEAVVGHGDKAFDYYTRIAPAYLEEDSDIHYLEPYVYAQMAAGKDASRFGQAKNSWLTGTASWNFVAISQYILGICADYDGIKINPCIPKDWKGYRVLRKFRGDTYDITIQNPNHVSSGVWEINIDGEIIKGNIIPYCQDGKTHVVTVVLNN